MIDWDDCADAIVSRLRENVADLETVLHIKDAETESNPARLPAAYVIMARTGWNESGFGFYDAVITWQVLVRCQRMAGDSGALALADLVLDTLAGYRPDIVCMPLVPVSCEFFREEMRPEPAYVLTFTTSAAQLQSENSTC